METKNKNIDLNGAKIFGVVGVGLISLALGLFFSAQAGLLTLIGAWLSYLIWKYPKQGFYCLLFFAPILPILKSTQILSAVSPLKDVTIFVLLIRTTILPIVKKEDPYRKNPLAIPLLLVIVWSFVALLASNNHVLGILRFRDIVLYVPLLWIARAIVSNKEEFVNFVKVIFSGLVFILGLAVIQMFFFESSTTLRFEPGKNVWIPRASSVLSHPNILASYLICLTPIVFSFLLNIKVNVWKRIILFIISLLSFAFIYLTYSRSGWIGITASLIVLAVLYVCRKGRKYSFAVSIIGLIVIITALAIPRSRTLLLTVVDPAYGSNQDRIGIVTDLLASVSNKDVFIGKGLGDIYLATGRTVSISVENIAAANVDDIRNAKDETFVDNAVLKTWIEEGLVGLLLVVWLLWNALKYGWEVSKNSFIFSKVFSNGFMASTMGLIILSFFLDVPEVFPVMLFWWTFVGVLESLPFMET